MSDYAVSLKVNGETKKASVRADDTLLRLLRRLDHLDVKASCEAGDCGACAVLLNGEAVNSCLVFAAQADGAEVVTVRGIGTEDALHPIQRQMVEKGGLQCGFCTPGIVVAAKALLDENPAPTLDEIRRGLAGNLCRCTGYQKIFEAVAAAAEEMRK
ncbi:MAG: (2Fe-2S)-binding protein [bacterium]|nr:(2Fe-2S)-binding protein [bacterium]